MSEIRCGSCGKFISYDEALFDAYIAREYTPSSEYTREKVEYFCRECSHVLPTTEGAE